MVYASRDEYLLYSFQNAYLLYGSQDIYTIIFMSRATYRFPKYTDISYQCHPSQKWLYYTTFERQLHILSRVGGNEYLLAGAIDSTAISGMD